MVDRIPKQRRSWNMSRIKGKDTKPELAVRSALHCAGYRFRVNRKDLPGKPDIVLPKFRTVIFVHGCFWHRHKGCKMSYSPKSNVEFWQEKFSATVARDKKAISALEISGWRVIVAWECEIKKDMKRLIAKIKKDLTPT